MNDRKKTPSRVEDTYLRSDSLSNVPMTRSRALAFVTRQLAVRLAFEVDQMHDCPELRFLNIKETDPELFLAAGGAALAVLLMQKKDGVTAEDIAKEFFGVSWRAADGK